ncbi:uncharacterized protein LOC128958144 [Oppia nitens]|uniref:uncharacterized protein LOC128958144 n=1 Tax=Oppia nitens TaxID=1686743 RepID=UPI0023D9E98C|nr:uncharacterized protein LOC128958144 [Oppia nitens]
MSKNLILLMICLSHNYNCLANFLEDNGELTQMCDQTNSIRDQLIYKKDIITMESSESIGEDQRLFFRLFRRLFPVNGGQRVGGGGGRVRVIRGTRRSGTGNAPRVRRRRRNRLNKSKRNNNNNNNNRQNSVKRN